MVSPPASGLIVTLGQPVLGTSGGSVFSYGSSCVSACARTLESWIAPPSSMPPKATIDVDFRLEERSACTAALGAEELVVTPHSISTFDVGRRMTPDSS